MAKTTKTPTRPPTRQSARSSNRSSLGSTRAKLSVPVPAHDGLTLTTPQPSTPSNSAPISPLTRRASGGNPYEAAAGGRRMSTFSPTRLGPTTSLWSTLDLMRARCRDEVRNNPWAASAVDNFEAQVIGKGIRPHWNIDDQKLKEEVEHKFRKWARLNHFYALQATAAREVFESGEVFCRQHIRPSSWGLAVPYELELIEGEQVPVFLNTIQGVSYGAGTTVTPSSNSIRCGIEFDPYKRIVAYHMYAEHPGETMFYPMSGLTFTRVPSTDILHVFKRMRAGLLRGQPHLGAVLVSLHEIGKYMDAAVVKKQIQTMFAGFVEKVDAGNDILPPDATQQPSVGTEQNNSSQTISYDSSLQVSQIETGTMQILLPGEKITFPQLPQDSDIATFLDVCLHQFAAGIGATYEQITGDLKGVNLSSIRAGVLDFQRKCEQFQQNVIIYQFIQPIVCRWLKEAVLSGELSLPGYANDPTKYENITWGVPGWPWLDPLNDAQANEKMVRDGFTSREQVIARKGEQIADVDRQQAADNKRIDELGLIYDSDARHTLLRGEKVTAAGEEEAPAEPASETGSAPTNAPAAKPVVVPVSVPAHTHAPAPVAPVVKPKSKLPSSKRHG